MPKSARNRGLTILALAYLASAAPAQAALITDSLLFETENQGMWSSGASAPILIEEFIGARWGTYREQGDNPLADLLGITPSAEVYTVGGFVGGANTCVGVQTWAGCAGFRADTTTGAQVTLTTSGQIGVYVGAELFGGGLDITVPINATVSLPDEVVAGQIFTVSTTGQTLAQGANITAAAPSFRAFIDGVFDTENNFFGKACLLAECAEGGFDVDINLGRFDLIEVDSSQANPWSVLGIEIPGVPLAKFTQRAPSLLNPDGVEETPPIDPTPEFLKTPTLLEVEAFGLQAQSGGSLSGDNILLTTSQDVLDAKWSLTGYAETYLRPPGSPAILKNKINLLEVDPFPSIAVTFTVANIEVGPVFAMRQQFNFDPRPAVRLQFDVPVTRQELVQVGTQSVKVGTECTFIVFCKDIFEIQPILALQSVTHNDGIVEIILGESAQLSFNNGIGQLASRTYVMSQSGFSNTTSLTGRMEAAAEFGCLSIPGIGDGCILDKTIGTSNHSLGSVNRTFNVGGFNSMSFTNPYQFNIPGGGNGGSDPVAVPEPGSLPLLLVGLLGIMGVSRRKLIRRKR